MAGFTANDFGSRSGSEVTRLNLLIRNSQTQ
jgi:hypothetical protein